MITNKLYPLYKSYQIRQEKKTKEEKAETETHPVTVEAKTSKCLL